ncbi:MAG: trehalose-phosphatase [Chloroflexota bacterium]
MIDTLHWSLHKDRLKQVIAAKRLGILSDFDGTLSHFVSESSQAAMTAENAQALDVLVEKVTLVALISGRSTADLRQRFERPHLVYYGNHGMDYWHDEAVQLVEVARGWEKPLQALLAAFGALTEPGVYINNKGPTASVNYRATSDPVAVRQRLLDRLQPLAEHYGLLLTEGREILEIKPPISVNKGTAVRTLITDYELDGAIFLGDDTTDLAAMSLLHEKARDGLLQGLTVGVISEGAPLQLQEHSDLIAYDPDDVAHLLNWIADQLPALPVPLTVPSPTLS